MATEVGGALETPDGGCGLFLIEKCLHMPSDKSVLLLFYDGLACPSVCPLPLSPISIPLARQRRGQGSWSEVLACPVWRKAPQADKVRGQGLPG